MYDCTSNFMFIEQKISMWSKRLTVSKYLHKCLLLDTTICVNAVAFETASRRWASLFNAALMRVAPGSSFIVGTPRISNTHTHTYIAAASRRRCTLCCCSPSYSPFDGVSTRRDAPKKRKIARKKEIKSFSPRAIFFYRVARNAISRSRWQAAMIYRSGRSRGGKSKPENGIRVRFMISVRQNFSATPTSTNHCGVLFGAHVENRSE